MTRQTSWLLAAALLACSTGYGQSKTPPVTPPKPLEKEKHVLPVVKENSSPSAKPGKTSTPKKGEQVRFRPPVIKKDPPPPPPPLPPAKKTLPPPPPAPPAKQ